MIFCLAARAGECNGSLASPAASLGNVTDGKELDVQRLFNIWLQTTVADAFKTKQKNPSSFSFSAETTAYFL